PPFAGRAGSWFLPCWNGDVRPPRQGGCLMYVTPDGKKIFVIDGHTHLWDARPENRRNRYGLTFIEVFWNGHSALTPPGERWNWDEFLHYGVAKAGKDLFLDGYGDHVILLP